VFFCYPREKPPLFFPLPALSAQLPSRQQILSLAGLRPAVRALLLLTFPDVADPFYPFTPTITILREPRVLPGGQRSASHLEYLPLSTQATSSFPPVRSKDTVPS